MSKDFEKKGKKFPKKGKKTHEFKNSNNRPISNTDSDKYNFQTVSESNDPRWYYADEQLLKDVASLPFSYASGALYNFGAYGSADQNSKLNKTSVPGLMTIAVAPTFGDLTEKENAPLNVALRNMGTFIRHKNSGATNYDYVDLGTYILAMGQAYAYLSYLKRLYGICRTYNQVNRYYPKTLVEANNVDFDSLINNLANFRAFINQYAIKLGSFCVPANLSILRRWQWLFEGYYQDAPDDKAQLYMYVPDRFYVFGLDTYDASTGAYSGAGALKFEAPEFTKKDGNHSILMSTILNLKLPGWRNRLWDIDCLIEMANLIINPIVQNQDFVTMSGDIKKAYDDNMIVKLDGITDDYTVYPVYDEVVLAQIENATLLGELDLPTCEFDSETHQSDARNRPLALFQSPSASEPYLPNGVLKDDMIFYHPYYTSSTGSTPTIMPFGLNTYFRDKLLNYHHGNINPAEVIDATRLTNIAYYRHLKSTTSDTDKTYYKIRTQGSEVATFGLIWVLQNHTIEDGTANFGVGVYADHSEFLTSSLSAKFQWTISGTSAATGYSEELAQYLKLVALITQFDWHPHFELNYGLRLYNSDGQIGGNNALFGDVDTYGYVTEQNLRNLSNVAMLSELAVTQYGKMVSFIQRK